MSSIKVGAFNAAMGRSGGDFDGQMILHYDGTNTTGIFRLIFQRTTFYNVTDKIKQVCYPSPHGDSWKEGVMDVTKNVFWLPVTRSTCTRQNVLLEQHSDDPAASSKRQRTDNCEDDIVVAPAPHHLGVLCPTEQQQDTSSSSTTAVDTNLEAVSNSSLSLASYWNS
ncbi:hypothetical protein MHU86_16494 [Fragilaria crotonensis]|nr:hypothetical protein MHU86_16494 [Fragilaria crotonensis]